MYEENKFKTCGKESKVYYTAKEIYKLSWGTTYQEAKTCIKERKYDVQIPSDGFIHKKECIKYSYDWQNFITTINYIKGYQRTCSLEKQCDSIPEYCGGCSWTHGRPIGYKNICKYVNVCRDNPVYENCMPTKASESRWYGNTVLTNYENCEREHGVFLNIKTKDGKVLDVGYCTVK